MVRAGMKLNEMLELDEAVLNFQQRRQRALTMRRYKSKIAAARKRMRKRAATKDKLQQRARKKAISIIRKKVAGQKGADYSNLNPAEKMMIDKRVMKRQGAIARIAKKLLPKVRKADLARISGKSVNEEFELFLEKTEVRQDPDIKDKKGTQPDVYYKGLAPSTKDKRDAHFKKGSKMDDDNPAAYKPAPGDARAETKPSKHTKKYQQMYGEEVAEASMNDTKPKKRYHEARKKDGTVKLDRRFRAFKSASKPGADMPEEFENDLDLLNFIEEVSNDIAEELHIDEAKQIKGLKTKAEKSGISYGILKKVYDRGIAAWRTGHRPGTTPQQWAFARVNSFLTGGKTRTTADKDLWAKAKSQKEEVELIPVVEEMSCPVATQNVKINTKNRDATIKNFMYGPLNVDEPGDYWEKVADKWDTTTEAAKKSKCSNCVAFDISERMKDCMPGETSDDDGELGYCWMHHFKCHSARTCTTWAKGGPITDDDKSYDWQERAGMNEVFDPWKIKKLASITINKKRYDYAKKLVQDIFDRKKKEAGGKPRDMRHGPEYYAAQIAKQVPGVEARILAKMIKEEYGDMDHGSDALRKKYQQDTPHHPVEDYVDEAAPDTDDAMKRYKAGKAGFTDIAHLKAKGLIAREDGTKRKSAKYENVNEKFEDMLEAHFKVEIEGLPDVFIDADNPGEVRKTLRQKLKKSDDVKGITRTTPEKIKQHFRMVARGDEDPTKVNEEVTQRQITDLEKFADRLLDKFGVDVEFTRHFADRMNDERNDPKITIPELQRFFKKIAKNKAKDIKSNPNSEAVLNDIQSDLNLPVVIKYNRDDEEFEVVNKTIMRKKNFKTQNKVIKY